MIIDKGKLISELQHLIEVVNSFDDTNMPEEVNTIIKECITNTTNDINNIWNEILVDVATDNKRVKGGFLYYGGKYIFINGKEFRTLKNTLILKHCFVTPDLSQRVTDFINGVTDKPPLPKIIESE